ncbi:bifunctional 2-methylcitrate synthase/citrate synthase [Antribacter sp. KLBMP9083]|uniref:Citrate synthase n=1 Tax=Antribacter soli TaxID=2910976 RepID=A0AA41U855_9MICO|nr:bifunctional 2-methylcitrate synthase/citrate synthase [Antribacter soli]MCF4122085.1 bifunctional 2-methylcitrate synthase/citrate synthase [Antribacter soli]
MPVTENAPEVHKGLAGVVADYTSISQIHEETNSLLYRGYPVQDLAARAGFEEVAYLLWHGELPTAAELADQTATERAHRTLPSNVRDAILELPLTCHPMDVCRTAVSVLGAHDPHAEDSSPQAELTKALRLWAVLPSVVALDQRRRRGQELVEPHDELGYAANFLWMTFGKLPDPAVVKAFEVSMTLYAEHSFNASTFTARVITSTLADLHSAVTGAIGALKGPLHGGANEAVMESFEEIGTADRAEAWLDDALALKKKIMGFGHRVYKHGDSRVPTMRGVLENLVEHFNRPDLLDLYTTLEAAMTERKGILPNLDYPAGPAYHLMGFDTNIFTPLFVASRVTGWTAHVMEQRAANSLIRPLCAYVGPERREVP